MKKNNHSGLGSYLLLWSTQMLSGLGSAMTGYALVIWSYSQRGSALAAAGLMVATYTPYVLCSVFAGALSDRWNKKRTMLACDSLAALGTLAVLVLLKTGGLRVWHLYLINALTGLMNTVQQPATEVAATALLPKEHYQKVGGLNSLGSSLNAILTPILATAALGLGGMELVIALDLGSFLVAFAALAVWIRIPETPVPDREESLLRSAKTGVRWLGRNPGILHLILFLAAVNLVSSMYSAAFPALMLPKPQAGERVMGLVNAVTGAAMLAGSLLASLMKPPKSRVRAIWRCLFFSLGTENFLLAFGRTPAAWCLGGCLGWVLVPVMNASLNAVLRLNIPVELQGRVYAARNCFQFFTIPVGYFLGGFLVDKVFEPWMAGQAAGLFPALFGTGKGSGAAAFFAVLWLMGLGVCLVFRRDPHIRSLES